LYQGNVATDEQMLRTGLNVYGTVDSAGCSRVFFGKDGKGTLSMAKFESWLRELNEEIVKMEFQHYDSHQQKGKLDPRDFALSLISAADPRVSEEKISEYSRNTLEIFDWFAWAPVTGSLR
jgi:hypothetical protein